MIKTLGQRSKEEERRTFEDGLRSVGSNYLFCPSLCRNCNNFSEENSTYPYKCKTGHSDHIAYKSKKEGYKQYDDCIYYKEKEFENIKQNDYSQKTSISDDLNPYERRSLEKEEERKQEELQRQQEEEEEQRKWEEKKEYERTHCFFCGEEGHLVNLHDKYFHENCLEKFKKSDKGKNWISEQEKMEQENKIFNEKDIQITAIVKKYNNYSNRIYEFLEFLREKNYHDGNSAYFIYKNHVIKTNNDVIEKFAIYMENKNKKIEEEKKKEKLEKEQQEKEAQKLKEEQEKEAKTIKAKKSFQRKIKLPVFIIGLLPIFYAFDTFSTNGWLPIISLAVIIFIFYKMLSGWINSAYNLIEEYTQKGNNPSKGYKFIVYSGVVLVSLAIYFGLLFLIMHILLKVW